MYHNCNHTQSKTASDALASIRHSYDELEQRHDDIGDSLRRQTSQSDLALRTLQLQCDEVCEDGFD